ncbi:MAG: hypothetical protein GEU78_07870 [Actinobacteria bacterium]|nr:hypothetical protein [Actinomycetota bacterium]
MEDADNALFSVVTGGFEKRPPTQTIAWLDFLDPDETYAVHPIDRDATEQVFILLASTSITAVNAITGQQLTVTVGDSARYYLIENSELGTGTGVVTIDGEAMSIQTQFAAAETTFDWSWQLSDATTGRFKIEGSVDGVVWNDIATGKGGAASGSFSTTIGAVAAGDHNFLRVSVTTGMASAADTITLRATFQDLTYLLGAAADDFRFVSVADNTFIANRTVTARMGDAGSGTIASTVQDFSDLPTASGSGNRHRVTGTAADGFGAYYVLDDPATSTWVEVVDPNAHNQFDRSSMPHRLVRNADGTYTFSAASWDSRGAGDEEITEQPPFIGKAIQDVVFFRNRLTFLADEEIYTSQAGNVLNLWPEKAVEVLDSDPVSRAATATDVNILKFATVFRKILFATSQRAQFELTSTNAFTPENAEFDLATSYTASPIAKPAPMADVLYFPSSAQTHGIVYEYFFDETTLSNTAADITKHIVDYIPNDIMQIATDATSSTVFVLTTGEQNAVFVYRTFFDGAEKKQSSWAKYTFGATESDAFIHGMAVMSGFLVLVIERSDGEIYLEQAPIEREEQSATVGFTPFMDQREVLTGTYNSTHDCTYWQTSWEHDDDAQIILGPDLAEPGRQPTPAYPDVFTLILETVAAGETIVINGVTFTAHASTTTAADREFDISGTDTEDAGELVSLINDGTFGVDGVTATDNSDGTIRLDVDDKCDGAITAPTGTAISGGTITALAVNDLVATSGDHDAGGSWIGRPYEMSVTLSEQFFREQEGAAVITGRLQLKDFVFHLIETGYLKATITPTARDPYVYTFEGKEIGSSTTLIGSASIAEKADFKVPVWSRSSEVIVTVSNDQPVPSVVSSAAWRGFFNELSRAE